MQHNTWKVNPHHPSIPPKDPKDIQQPYIRISTYSHVENQGIHTECVQLMDILSSA